MRKNDVILFIGQSGSGKGTQAELLFNLCKKLFPKRKIMLSGTGDLFRNSIPFMSPFIRRKLKKIQESGRVQPGAMATVMWGFNFMFNWSNEKLIMEGSPRSKNEAQAIVDFFTGVGKRVILFDLDITREIAEVRMKERKRNDTNTKQKRKNKLDFFDTNVVPGIRLMKRSSNVDYYKIPMGTIEDTYNLILEKLEKHYA